MLVHAEKVRHVMVDECVVAVFPSTDAAKDAVHRLAESDFPAGQVSLVTVGLQDHPELVKELELGDDSLHDAAVTAELGSVVGILTGLSVMALSGLGAVFLVGPIGGAIGAFTSIRFGTTSAWSNRATRW
jgi:hypothetical protein